MNTLPLLLVCAAAANPQFDGELLDFTATWCGPCQQMSPIVHRLQRQGLPIRQVDVDRNRSLAQKYGVTNIPAFVLVVNGRVVDRVVGVTSESRLRSMAKRIPRVSAIATRDRSTRTSPTSADLGSATDFPGATVRANNDNAPDRFAVPAGVSKTDAATVRIRVVDEDGVNYGSGTIVESKAGRAVLLSCGHIFRDLDDASRIEVDVFRWAKGKIAGKETFVGDVLGYDLESDVGLLTIPADAKLPVCPVAGNGVKVGDRVLNIGCSQGELPTRQIVRVKQLNRYLGPDNIECTGVPVQGRSGGGLFNTTGEIVGICIARDPRDQEGIYAGLKAIHEMLDQRRLAHLYPNDTPAPTRTAETKPARAAANPGRNVEVASDVAKVLDDAGEAEVICIIRKHGEPESRSRVVIINRASSKFVSYLSGEMKDQPRLTSGHVDRPSRERILEGSGWQIVRKPGAATSRSQCSPDRPAPPPQRYRRSAASR